MWKYFRLIPELFSDVFNSGECPDGAEEATPSRRFFNIGHRGSPCYEVENTIPSFQRALDVDGANGLELDLCMTADGVVVVWHDWDPNDGICKLRISGMEPDVKYCPSVPEDDTFQKPLHELTYQEFIANYGYTAKDGEEKRVGARIPTLDELMRWAVTQDTLEILFLDIKVPECSLELVPHMIDRIEEVLERHAPRFTIVFETMYQSVLDAMKRRSPGSHYTLDVAPIAGVVLDPAAFSAVQKAIDDGNGFATPQRPRPVTVVPWTTYRRIVQYDLDLRDDHHRRHREGGRRTVVGFTVNDEEEMRCLVRMGIDGLQTDRPDILAKVLAEEKIGRWGERTSGGAGAHAGGVAQGSELRR